MTHGNTRWFAFDRKVKPPAAAGGVSAGHDLALGFDRTEVSWISGQCTTPSYVPSVQR
jgi:hypothetical protein